MTSNELRQQFLDFFASKGHRIMPPASLVPKDDPTVLFNTAGMQQFKRYFISPTDAPSKTVTTCQPCVRTSDIEEVGDKTHLTFFEMLGNFAFNDYFKKEAISYAWEFLTEVLRVEKDRIYATYFEGDGKLSTDEESLKILNTIDGLKEIKPQGFDDNFWSLGLENSPGGPTVEFYVDGIEIWNLVFNEYIFKNGAFKKTQFHGVDTGMGLERMLNVINKSENVYHTDLFQAIHDRMHDFITAKDPTAEKIILDHIKAAVFILNTGITPANKDQGYVVRRLIRRAIVKLSSLGATESALKALAQEVFKTYSEAYEFNQEFIIEELLKEEKKFQSALNQGLRLLSQKEEIKGKDLFDLYQSFGLPLEIAQEEARTKNLIISEEAIKEYEELLKTHQEKSRTASAGMFKGGLTSESEQATKYHTATHLLLASLRQVLGKDVHQRGSNITDERLRFDFSWPEKMTPEQLKQVETLVNEKIQADLPVSMSEMRLEDAQNCGAEGVFGEKYGEVVKVYTVGQAETFFSREICGGPHVENTGVLGHFKIQKEESSSAGVRRIKAVLE